MKVYIAKRHWDYEGFDIIGVYATFEAANKANGCDTCGDCHTVAEFEVESIDDLEAANGKD